MARTISQISGEFGLSRGATADPFSKQEAAVLSNVQRSLQDIRSQQLESESGRGFGRSSFADAAFSRQAEGVVGQVGQQFAQARTQEQLAENQFQRNIIGQQVGADVSSRLLGEQTAAEQQLIGSRGAEQRLTDIAGVEARTASEQQLIGARGSDTRQTLAQQIAGQQDLSAQQAQQQLGQLEAATQAETGLIGARAESQKDLLADQIAGQSALSTQEAAQQIDKIQAAAGVEEGLIGARGAEQRLGIQEQAQAAESLAQVQGIEQRITQSQNFQEQGNLINQKAEIQTQQANQQFQNDLALLNQKYDRVIQSLPEEFKLKAEYEEQVFENKLQITREQQIVDFATEAAFTQLLSILGGDLPGLDLDLPEISI